MRFTLFSLLLCLHGAHASIKPSSDKKLNKQRSRTVRPHSANTHFWQKNSPGWERYIQRTDRVDCGALEFRGCDQMSVTMAGKAAAILRTTYRDKTGRSKWVSESSAIAISDRDWITADHVVCKFLDPTTSSCTTATNKDALVRKSLRIFNSQHGVDIPVVIKKLGPIDPRTDATVLMNVDPSLVNRYFVTPIGPKSSCSTDSVTFVGFVFASEAVYNQFGEKFSITDLRRFLPLGHPIATVGNVLTHADAVKESLKNLNAYFERRGESQRYDTIELQATLGHMFHTASITRGSSGGALLCHGQESVLIGVQSAQEQLDDSLARLHWAVPNRATWVGELTHGLSTRGLQDVNEKGKRFEIRLQQSDVEITVVVVPFSHALYSPATTAMNEYCGSMSTCRDSDSSCSNTLGASADNMVTFPYTLGTRFQADIVTRTFDVVKPTQANLVAWSARGLVITFDDVDPRFDSSLFVFGRISVETCSKMASLDRTEAIDTVSCAMD